MSNAPDNARSNAEKKGDSSIDFTQKTNLGTAQQNLIVAESLNAEQATVSFR
jgi:hypothetical protein